VELDSVHRHEQVLGDLAVQAAGRCQLGDPALASR